MGGFFLRDSGFVQPFNQPDLLFSVVFLDLEGESKVIFVLKFCVLIPQAGYFYR